MRKNEEKNPIFQSNEDHYKTQFTDLNEDCLFLILERLDLGDSLSAAQINGEISTVAADVFRYKYSHFEVMLSNDIPFSDKLEKTLNGQEIDTTTIERISKNQSYRVDKKRYVKVMSSHVYRIYFDDFHAILNTFKHFGHEIKKVKSTITTLSWQTKLIAYLIDEYSSESLVEINLGDQPNKLLNHIKKPLVKVESVIFDYSNFQFDTPNVRFIELFPGVRRLNLDYLNNHGLSYLDCHMPQLEHVSLEGREIPIPGVIAKNPQIRSFESCAAKPEFLRELNTLLPQLETLILKYLEQTGESVRFENVTTFEIRSTYASSPPGLNFPRLENLKISGTRVRFGEYLAFFNEHKHLSHLHMELIELNHSDLHLLTANLTDLMELTFECAADTDTIIKLNSNAIVEFLKKHEKVTKINFINFSENWKSELEPQLKDGWNTITIELSSSKSCLSFERKFNDQI